MPDRDEDIQEVMAEEKSRGSRQPTSPAARRERAKRLRDVKVLLQQGTEDDIKAAIRAAGIPLESPAAVEILRIWREYRES
jgi:hypothetical protein